MGHHRSIHLEKEWPKKMMLIDHWGLDGFEGNLIASKKKNMKSSIFDWEEDKEWSAVKSSKFN